MLIIRKNRLAGRALTGYPIVVDEKTGLWGLKIGYCEGCNEPITLRTIDARDFASAYGASLDQYYKFARRLQAERRARTPLNIRFAKWLLKDEFELKEKGQLT